jgi:hypothetical protein
VRHGVAVIDDFQPEADSRAARTHAETSVPAPVDALPDLCVRALQNQPQFKLRGSTGSRVEIRRRINWKTWGESLTVEFERLDEGHTKVSVDVEPLLGMALVDYGQGRRDATDLLRAPWQLAQP